MGSDFLSYRPSERLLDSSNLDNAGRQEVSLNVALGEYNFLLDDLPLFFDQETVGAGASISHNTTLNGVDLSVSANTEAAVIQTKQRHPYFPGHAQQAEFTFIGFAPEADVIKRVGYFSSSTASPFSASLDGFFLESSAGSVSLNIAKDGAVVSIDQSSWLDPLDGTGKSGYAIDWNNFQVFLFDFLYLGGTYLNLYWIANGKRHLVHRYNHANAFPAVIVDSPLQPIRSEVRSSGGSGGFTQVCSQVSTLGGGSDFGGIPVFQDTGNSSIALSTSGTEYPVVGLRKNIRNVELFLENLSFSISAGANEIGRWRLLLNPTLSAGLTWNPITNTGFDGAVGDGSITVTTANFIIASGASASRGSAQLSPSQALRIGETISGTFDEIVFCFTPLSAGQDIAASLGGVSI